jgi:uncharacterized phage protein (TIGR02218 family)
MKTISGALATHYAGQVTTIATCWKVTRTDGEIFGYTDHVADLEFEGVTYLAATGHQATNVDSSSDLGVDNLDVQGFLDDESLREVDLVAGLWDFAEVRIFEVNYADLTMGARLLRRGRLGEVRIAARPRRFVAELRGLAQALQQTVGKVYQPACRANLGDDDCGVDLVPLTATGQAVTGVTDRRTFVASGLADGHWQAGLVTWTSGLNTGFSMEVKTWTNGTKTLVLCLPMPYAIAASDQFTIQPGCLKRLGADCRDKYSNVVNFRGEPYVPGIDSMTRGPI